MTDAILSVNNLRKVYKDKPAVDSVSFDVAPREIVGLLGPNGAGKTTTINVILGVLEPSGGEVAVSGMDIRFKRSEILKKTSFAAAYAPLPGNLTVYQNLRVFALLYGVKDVARKLENLLKRFDLEKFRHTKCGVLSSGEQTRVGLAKAMLNDPDLLLLDEPTASLDPSVASDIRSNIRDYARSKGCGVLWTSHNMYEVEAVCDRVLFLFNGRILLEGDPKTLPSQHGKVNLEELFIAVARHPLSLEGR